MKLKVLLITLLLLGVGYSQMNMSEVAGRFKNQDSWNSQVLTGEKEFSYIQLGSLSIGTDAFTTTAAVDTVVISGIETTDIFIVTGKYVAGVDQQDVLQWRCTTDTLFVYRLASGESAGAYSWLRIKTE